LRVAGAHDASGSRSDTRWGIGIGLNREELNRGNWIVAFLVMSTRFSLRCSLRHCVPFQAGEFGLDKDCVAQAEMIVAVEPADDTGAVVSIDGQRSHISHG